MNVWTIAAIAGLALVETLAAYMHRVYSEFGKILTHEVEENLDAWEKHIEPHLGLGREHAAMCSLVLQQLVLGMIALLIGATLFDHAPHPGTPTYEDILQAALSLVLVVVLCNLLLPTMLFQRTRGPWVRHLLWPIRLLLWMMTPITVLVRFFFSVASLGDEPTSETEEASGDVEALLEAGEEEGILEESDRELVRSAVEFGDMLVREVMTPRPRVFAVPATTTLEKFLELLRENNFSRVPVYSDTLDHITGIAFSHDLLQISDEEAQSRMVTSIQRPAAFVPETKRGYELLREMQNEKQHMRVVVDEYGGVAGVVTIEDLLEEIVGDICDEHEDESLAEEPQQEASGAWLVPGKLPIDQLEELLGDGTAFAEPHEATTIGGLISETEGRIPLAGEVVLLEPSLLRVEVVASTDRLIEQVRVFPPQTEKQADIG